MAAKKKTAKKEAAGTMVRVKAKRHLHEGGEHRNPGDEFEVTAARAKAIAHHVEPV